MKVTIDQKWNFIEALNAAREAYIGWGKTSTGYRNSVMMVWGTTVGKTRALNDFNQLIKEHGSKKKLAEYLYLSDYSLGSLLSHFKSLPDDLEVIENDNPFNFIENMKCSLEEDLTHEFKEIKGSNPTKAIQSLVDEYILAFINSSGGSVFWGICDDGNVKSIKLNSAKKDEIRKVINNKVHTIEPKIDPTKIIVLFHSVQNSNGGFVLEVRVPKSNSIGLYFNSSGNTWVRVNGCKQRLQGLALQDYIIQRMHKNN